jgi:caa(3)-type oxidase subunit IV
MSEGHSAQYYVKIWAILVALLIISVIGPMFEILWLTLATAFGIACVKAWLVATRFMHIREEPVVISYAIITSLVFMALFFAGTAPDVMQPSGTNWVKTDSWQADSAAPGSGPHHSDAHADEHADQGSGH